MLRLDERQRKCAIYRYYLEKKEAFPLADKDTVPDLGITRRQFNKWEAGEVSLPNTLKKRSKSWDKADLKIAEMFRDDYGVMEMGKKLGLTRAECRKAIDELAGRLSPTFQKFSVTPERSKRLINTFQGQYIVYRWERSEHHSTRHDRDTSIMCMTLSVRFALSGNKRLSRDLHRLRCKLNIPSYRLNFDLYEYDGYLSDVDGGGVYYWMFEDRKVLEGDLVFMMTNALEQGPNGDFATGIMVSRNQDRQSKPAIWPILLVKAQPLPPIDEPDENFDISAEQAFYDEFSGLLDPGTVDPWVKEQLNQTSNYDFVSIPYP